MTFEIAFHRANETLQLDKLVPRFLFQCSDKKLQQNNILRGFFDATTLEFCKSHLKETCQNCIDEACDACCFKCNVMHELPSVELVIKCGDSLQKKIWFEAQIQQRLSEQYRQNVARCVGNYDKFYYFVRRKGALNWLSAKICVFIQQCEDRWRTSSIESLASQQPPKKFVVEFEQIVGFINDSIYEMALLFNSATHDTTNQLRINWKDRDYCQKHNFFIVSTNEPGLYNYVFFDFGRNLCLSAS